MDVKWEDDSYLHNPDEYQWHYSGYIKSPFPSQQQGKSEMILCFELYAKSQGIYLYDKAAVHVNFCQSKDYGFKLAQKLANKPTYRPPLPKSSTSSGSSVFTTPIENTLNKKKGEYRPTMGTTSIPNDYLQHKLELSDTFRGSRVSNVKKVPEKPKVSKEDKVKELNVIITNIKNILEKI